MWLPHNMLNVNTNPSPAFCAVGICRDHSIVVGKIVETTSQTLLRALWTTERQRYSRVVALIWLTIAHNRLYHRRLAMCRRCDAEIPQRLHLTSALRIYLDQAYHVCDNLDANDAV